MLGNTSGDIRPILQAAAIVDDGGVGRGRPGRVGGVGGLEGEGFGALVVGILLGGDGHPHVHLAAAWNGGLAGLGVGGPGGAVEGELQRGETRPVRRRAGAGVLQAEIQALARHRRHGEHRVGGGLIHRAMGQDGDGAVVIRRGAGDGQAPVVVGLAGSVVEDGGAVAAAPGAAEGSGGEGEGFRAFVGAVLEGAHAHEEAGDAGRQRHASGCDGEDGFDGADEVVGRGSGQRIEIGEPCRVAAGAQRQVHSHARGVPPEGHGEDRVGAFGHIGLAADRDGAVVVGGEGVLRRCRLLDALVVVALAVAVIQDGGAAGGTLGAIKGSGGEEEGFRAFVDRIRCRGQADIERLDAAGERHHTIDINGERLFDVAAVEVIGRGTREGAVIIRSSGVAATAEDDTRRRAARIAAQRDGEDGIAALGDIGLAADGDAAIVIRGASSGIALVVIDLAVATIEDGGGVAAALGAAEGAGHEGEGFRTFVDRIRRGRHADEEAADTGRQGHRPAAINSERLLGVAAIEVVGRGATQGAVVATEGRIGALAQQQIHRGAARIAAQRDGEDGDAALGDIRLAADRDGAVVIRSASSGIALVVIDLAAAVIDDGGGVAAALGAAEGAGREGEGFRTFIDRIRRSRHADEERADTAGQGHRPIAINGERLLGVGAVEVIGRGASEGAVVATEGCIAGLAQHQVHRGAAGITREGDGEDGVGAFRDIRLAADRDRAVVVLGRDEVFLEHVVGGHWIVVPAELHQGAGAVIDDGGAATGPIGVVSISRIQVEDL